MTGADHIRQFFSRLFTPRYVRLTVHKDVLPELGWIGNFVSDEFKDYRGIAAPRMVIEMGGLVERSNYPQPSSSDTRSNDGKAKDASSPRVRCCRAAVREHPGEKRMIDPLTNTHRCHSSRNCCSVRPVTSDAGKQCGGGDACDGVPPLKVFADSRNAHSLIPSHPTH